MSITIWECSRMEPQVLSFNWIAKLTLASVSQMLPHSTTLESLLVGTITMHFQSH